MENVKHIITVMSGVTDGGCEHCNDDDDIKHCGVNIRMMNTIKTKSTIMSKNTDIKFYI